MIEWQAFQRIHGPIGQRRDDYLAALIASTIANVNRPKNASPAPLSDFLIPWDEREVVEDGDDGS